MYIRDLEMVHKWTSISIADDGQKARLDSLFELLESLEAIQSETTKYGSLVSLIELLESWSWLDPRLDIDDTFDVSRVSYVAGIFETIMSGWDGVYGLMLECGSSANVVSTLVWIKSHCDRDLLSAWLNTIENKWHSDMKTPNVVHLLHFIYRCNKLKVFAKPVFYGNIAELLGFENEFITTYFAAMCLKIYVTRNEGDAEFTETDDQYCCLRMMYGFQDWPGSKYG